MSASALRLAASVVPACAAAVLAAASLPAVAGAQNVIPGDSSPGRTVVTALGGVGVSVSQPGPASVTVTMSNSSGRTLTCAGPDGNSPIGGTVTEARVAQGSMAYYASFPYKPDPAPTFGSTAAGNTIGANVPLGPILGFLPSGSAAPALGPAYAARDGLEQAQAAAVRDGHSATFPAFTVNSGGSSTRTVTLGLPASGAREDFDAAAFLVCRDPSGQAFAFAGYETGAPPATSGNGLLTSGSLG